jgi:uncharacterized protein YndB with AHSA1/START domain
MNGRGVPRKIPDGYEVIFERHIPHPPERVWAMLTEPAMIETWFCARVDIALRLGGKMVEHHDHVGVDVRGEVTRWEPPRVFGHSWWFGGSREPQGTVVWELFPEASGTRLVLTHRRESLDEGGVAGAHVCLDVLYAVLDGADPKAHLPPVGEFRDGEFVQTRAGRGLWANREKLEREYRHDFARRSSLWKTEESG